MPAIVIRDIPVGMHRRLKSAALQHHRSMNQEVLTILEQTLASTRTTELPPPVSSLKPIGGDIIVKIIRNMRDRTE